MKPFGKAMKIAYFENKDKQNDPINTLATYRSTLHPATVILHQPLPYPGTTATNSSPYQKTNQIKNCQQKTYAKNSHQRLKRMNTINQAPKRN